MHTYLVLLRGINVSGKKIIKMEGLRQLFESAGYENVQTYIQSGNVIFDSEVAHGEVAGNIEKLIETHYGFDVTVFVLTQNELNAAVGNMPFAEGREEEPPGLKQLYVTFLSEIPSNDNLEKLRQSPIGDDLIEVVDKVLYFKLASKASDSKLSNNLIESKLKVSATTRNWNTTLKLLAMMDSRT